MRKKVIVTFLLTALLACLVLSGCSKEKKSEEAPKATVNQKLANKKKTEDTAAIQIDADVTKLDESYNISELLYGVFLEDINYAVDGGLYAEMVKNRSFEYANLAIDGAKHGWECSDETKVSFEVKKDAEALNGNNPSYAVITNQDSKPQGIGNRGFLDGMAIKAGVTYKFSAYIKGLDGYKGKVYIKLASKDGAETYAETSIDAVTDKWWKYEAELLSGKEVNQSLRLFVSIDKGSVALDMVSLFPSDTYNGRENGLRADLVEYLKELQPSFLRFPGGCVIEGKTYESAYNWKDSIGNGMEFEINGEKTVGDVAVRPQGIDLWADLNREANNPYYTTYGLGFYEYFLLCEDLDCLGVPILNAGMTCPIQSPNYQVRTLNSEEFAQCIQDALDLVEFCRGDKNTKWGAVRIAMGHEEPFELKYIGIGNEQWQDEYYLHYAQFKEAFEEAAKKNPEMYQGIELIVANGPNSGDRFAWDKIQSKNDNTYAGLVDEHYYQTPDWFLGNVNRYDSYDRDSVPVFLGEYAAKSNNMNAALAEAAYMTGLEKNADIVKMACYAPLFGNDTKVQWTPDMIWFNNHQVYGSVNYYAQKIFMNNVGTKMVNSSISVGEQDNSLTGRVGVGTWSTSARFDDMLVVDNETGEELYRNDFSDGTLASFIKVAGQFSIDDGVLVQSNTEYTKSEATGDVTYVGDANWSNYTYTVTATKTGGDEGFLIPVAVTDKNNNIFWNIGGWGNTVSCLQIVSDGVKSDQVQGTVKDIHLSNNKEYKIKMVVQGNKITGYLNDVKMFDYTHEATSPLYESVSIDEESKDLIIKVVNVTGTNYTTDFTIENFGAMAETADVQQIVGSSLMAQNTSQNPESVTIENTTEKFSENFKYQLPAYSITVIRIHAQ